MALVVKTFKNGQSLEQTFNDKAYFNSVLVNLAYKKKVIDLPVEFFQNNLEGLRQRRNRALTESELSALRKLDLAVIETKLINYLTQATLVLEGASVKEYLEVIHTYSYGNLEEIYAYLCDIKPDKVMIYQV